MNISYRPIVLAYIIIALSAIDIQAQNPNWSSPLASNYQFTASVIAAVRFNNMPSNSLLDSIAFFDGNEIRGLGTAIPIGNGIYRHFVTLYSNQAIDTLSIHVYYHGTNYIYDVQNPFVFKVQNIQGSVDNPYVINIYPENNAPIGIQAVPPQYTVEGLAFLPIDMAQYLIQPDNNPVVWSYTPNDSLIVSFIGSQLNVSGANGFTGHTSLVVRATEQAMNALMQDNENNNLSSPGGNGNRSIPQIIQFAETTISFNVTPLYDAPLWQPVIPNEGIIQGGQFGNVSLHDYENLYEGPFIKYDYIPVIEESIPVEPRPTWTVSQNFGTTMSVLAKLQFTPKYHFHHVDDVLAAFAGSEIRGVATQNAINDIYYLSIGGAVSDTQTITLKFYSGEMKKVSILDSFFQFQPFGIVGNDTAPLIIELASIVPIVPDTLVPNGIYSMPINIIDPDFIGTQKFKFMAMDPLYPDYLRDETIAAYCIVADSSDLTTYYEDADGDGLGNSNSTLHACTISEGYVTNDDDCNDNDPFNMGATLSIVENSGTPNDGMICSSINTVISIDQAAQSYLWSTGQTSQSIAVNPASTSTYSVTITFGTSCIDTQTTTIFVEGAIVMNDQNTGFGSLRNVLECAVEGDSISYNYPLNNSSHLTESLLIVKDITIYSASPINPEITIDFNAALNGIMLSPNKSLYLENINIKSLNHSAQNTFSGTGQVIIQGSTNILNE